MKVRTTTHGISCEADKPSSDAFDVRAWNQTVIAVLCDGAGSGAPAREAAQRAVSSLIDNYQARPRIWDPARALREFTQLINRALHLESQARFDRTEMISTLVAVSRRLLRLAEQRQRAAEAHHRPRGARAHPCAKSRSGHVRERRAS
jgi:serine/threonine protein phosphatase PrpC